MDCYPEYHNHYQHYNNIHNTYFPSNNSPSMHRFGSTQLNNNNENQPSPFYEGFSRHNLHHYSSGQGSFSPSSFEHTNNESSQFYYANMHQQPTSSYYGNHHNPHTYDSYSYRNIPSNYRYHYGYHHHYPTPPPPTQIQNHPFYPLHQHHHQQQQSSYNSSNSSDHHYNHYSTQPPSSTPSQQQQGGEYNSPSNHTRSNSNFSPSSTTTSFNSTSMEPGRQSSEKPLDKDLKHTDVSTINSTNVTKTNELDDKTNNTLNDQQVNVSLSSQESSVEKQDENSNVAPKEILKDEKAINKNDENNTEGEEEIAKKHKNESFNENENCKENQQHIQNEEATSATDYLPESSKVNKVPQENNEKQQNVAPTSGISRLSEHHNIPNLNDRSSTPIGYNSHSNISSHNYSHKRYPMSWYSQHEYYNNWMMNPDDRRNFPDPQTFFSSMRNKSKNHNPDKHKMHDNSPSSTKRTKRKPKLEDSVQKVDPNKDNMKNVTPLPGFLQTFGQTEIGKFSEAFYTSDSPLHYYNNNIESDIDSPQLDWDSLDGPIGNPMPMQVASSSFYMYGSENEFDSPISSFNEIMCKDF